MRFSDKEVFIARAVANETVFSDRISLDHIYGYSVFAKWAGSTIAGSILLQASVNGDDWVDLADTQTITGADSYIWNVPDAMYRYFRVELVSDDANVITFDVSYYAKGV